MIASLSGFSSAPMVLMSSEPGTSSPITVCTLWEKDYHKGLGTFVNSLVRTGYHGRVWAGYRGVLPEWAAAGRIEAGRCILSPAEGVELVLCKIDADIHFAQYKASWMLRVLKELEPAAHGIYYFDPDSSFWPGGASLSSGHDTGLLSARTRAIR